MNYYKYLCDSDNYHSFVLDDDEQYQGTLYQLLGTLLAKTWSPLRVRLYKTRFRGDFPHLTSHVPVFSEKAVEVLLPLIKDATELLPLECLDCDEDTVYYAVHVLDLIDCLDYSQSKITRDPGGEIIFIDHYVFNKEKVRDRDIFRIKEAPLKDVIISSRFVSLVNDNALQGLKPKRIA